MKNTYIIDIDKFYSSDIAELSKYKKIAISIPKKTCCGNVSDPDSIGIMTRAELREFVDKVHELKQLGTAVGFTEGFSVMQAIKASRKINKWVNDIKRATLNGEPLSVYEQYLYAYDLATNYEYQWDESDERITGQVVHVLDTGFAICTGHSSLLKCLLDRLGIPCYLQQYLQYNPDDDLGHVACVVYLNDLKYNINGLYFSDPCFDSIRPLNKHAVSYSNRTYSEIQPKYSHLKFNKSCVNVQIKNEDASVLLDKTPAISKETQEEALKNMFLASISRFRNDSNYKFIGKCIDLSPKETDEYYAKILAKSRMKKLTNTDVNQEIWYDSLQAKY